MQRSFFGSRKDKTFTEPSDSEDRSCENCDHFHFDSKNHRPKHWKNKNNSNSRYFFESLVAEQTECGGHCCQPKSEESEKFVKSKINDRDSSPCKCPSCSKGNTTFGKKPKGVFSTVVEPNQNINNAHFETESSKIDKNEKCLMVNEHRNEIPVQEKEYQEPTKLNQFSLKQVPRPSGDDIINYTDQSIKFDVCPAREQQLECGDMAQRSRTRKSIPCPKQLTEVCVKGVKELPEKQEKTCSGNKESVFPFRNTPSGNLIVVPHQVVFESKQLSIVAANPYHTKVNIKTDLQTEMNRPNDIENAAKKSSFPFLTLDPNSENFKNWKNNELFNKPKAEDGDNCATFRAEIKLPANKRGHSPRADGDFPSDETELFTDSEQGQTPKNQGKNGEKNIVSLQPEMNLLKMGFSDKALVDWTKIELPLKTDLHKLLHHKIINYENPDVLIKIGNHEYRCHLLVLQCYSSFFNDKPLPRIEIPESCVTKTAFMYIYDWMIHLGHDSYQLLRRDNILEVFMAAQYLGVKELEEQCWAFIDNEELFSEDKAFMLYLDARRYGNTAVMELMVPRVQTFFLILVSSKDFVELVLEEVCVFLKSNYICIHGEIEVFMSAVRWLMFNWEERSQYLVEVMRCVRFGLIAPWQLVDIRRNPESEEFLLVTKGPEVSKMIEDGLGFAIIKYWYGHESSDYYHWIDLLGLTEPVGRNWVGTEKNYVFYRDFLADLNTYRKTQRLVKKQSKCANKIADVSIEDCNNLNEPTQLLPPPPPVPCSSNKRPAPLQTMAEFMARPQSNNIQETGNKYNELNYQNTGRVLPQLGYDETKLLKRMFKEQERLDMELKNRKNKDKYKENQHRIEDLKNKIGNMLKINADQITKIVREEIRNENELRTKSTKTNFKTALREKSAVIIQSVFRGYLARKLFKRLIIERNKAKCRNLLKSKSVPTLQSNIKSYTNLNLSSEKKHYLSPDSLFFPEEESILVFGGMDPHTDYGGKKNSGKNIYRYLPNSDKWELVGEMPEPLHHHGATFYKGKVIIAGGRTPEQMYNNSDAVTRTVWCFDPATRGWSHMPSLLHPRTNFGFVTCKGKLYAIGGQDHKNRFLKSVEMYDASAGHWTFVSNLQIGRSGLAAAKFKDQIWVAGGIVDVQKNAYICTSSVEVFDYTRNKWYLMKSLQYPCCYSVLFPTDERLYLIGGCIGDRNNHVIGSTNIIDEWNPKRQRWYFKTNFSIPRHAHSVCCRDSQVIIIGGVSAKLMRGLKSVERWDLETGAVMDVAKLPTVLSGLCSISLPPASLL